ncbi:hypothetical protein MTO96_006906 [Rhipicephalus appendiculatus]
MRETPLLGAPWRRFVRVKVCHWRPMRRNRRDRYPITLALADRRARVWPKGLDRERRKRVRPPRGDVYYNDFLRLRRDADLSCGLGRPVTCIRSGRSAP